MTNGINILQNGIKIINNRLSKATPDYSIPNRFKLSINTPDINYTDTALATLIPISGTETVDDCSATTGWTANLTNAVSLNTTTFKPDSGTDGSLSLTKTNTSSATLYAEKNTSSLNGTSKDFIAWIYIKDATALATLTSTGTALNVRFGTDNSNYYNADYLIANLVIGWNYLKKAIPTDFNTVGSPTITNLAYTRLTFTTNTTTATLSANNLIFDSLRLASADDYYKAVDSIIADENEGSLTIISKLTVSEANGFLIDGHSLYNTDTPELIFTKSKFNGNSKGTADLFKFTTKIKIRNVNQ